MSNATGRCGLCTLSKRSCITLFMRSSADCVNVQVSPERLGKTEAGVRAIRPTNSSCTPGIRDALAGGFSLSHAALRLEHISRWLAVAVAVSLALALALALTVALARKEAHRLSDGSAAFALTLARKEAPRH
eukprot:1306944-Rhodomonas_salina.4